VHGHGFLLHLAEFRPFPFFIYRSEGEHTSVT
jgi:hypothetical protein